MNLTTARRVLQIGLGLLWLLDAALQFQPYMFTRAFVTQTLAPAAQGNPSVVATPMHWAFHLMAAQPVLTNFAFASTQLLIALGLFWGRTVKVALALSIAWALGVWWFGEGLGGVLNGASPYSGAPGAVLIYALVAVLLWPADSSSSGGSVAERGLIGRWGARVVWIVFWGSTAYLLVRAPNSGPNMAHDMVASAAADQPGWLAAIDHHLASLFGGAGVETAIAFAVVAQLVAISLFVPRFARAGVVLAIAMAFLLWLMQGLGGVFTGTGTDPNSGPLLAILAISFWPLRSLSAAPTWRTRAGIVESELVAAQGSTTDARSLSKEPAEESGRWRQLRPTTLRGLGTATLGLIVAGSLSLTGATAAQAASNASRGPGTMAGMKMSSNANTASASAVPHSLDGPSRSARMICGSETRHEIAMGLGLASDPLARSSWADHLYTCIYTLPEGTLVLSVKQQPDDEAAQSYLDDLSRTAAGAVPIEGLASLGLPGFESSTGTVMFRKDNMTLDVNAAALPRQLGTKRLARNNFAYQIATDILACWSGK